MLAADASACAAARDALGAISSVRHSSSKMNPNTCTICELMFTTVMKARKVTVDATVLFADLRGYTGLSQSLSPDAISGLLDTFYDECANAFGRMTGCSTRP